MTMTNSLWPKYPRILKYVAIPLKTYFNGFVNINLALLLLQDLHIFQLQVGNE